MSSSSVAKSANPFARSQSQWSYFEDNYLPKYYEQDLYQTERTTFRSVSPKIYNQQKEDYFTEINDELEMGDDGDALYEATLMNANFLASFTEEEKPVTSSLDRLRQILGHINPGYASRPAVSLPDVVPAPSVRSQFSSSSAPVQPQSGNPMRAFSMPNPLDPKGKGKFNPTL